MGSHESNLKNAFIQPAPGILGGILGKSAPVLIYTDRQVFTMKYNPRITVKDIRQYLRDRLGVGFRLYCQEKELDDLLTLQVLNKARLIQAIQQNPTCNNMRKTQCLPPCFTGECSDSYKKSRNSSASKIDFSLYAAPDIGTIKKIMPNKNRGSDLRC